MDGVLVDNMRIHARAYDIFYERHGVGNRQNVLKELSGLGNDEIMQRLFTPERLAELGGWQALSEEKEAIYRELYEPLIRPTAGLLDFLEALRREGIACAVGSSAEMRNIRFVFDPVARRVGTDGRDARDRRLHADERRAAPVALI